MKICHTTPATGTISGINGFGYATQGMLKSLSSLGYHVTTNDASADVEIAFNQPHNVKWVGCDYKILFFPWESDQLIKGWADLINEADEVWTPSPIIASWMPGMGINRPIYVYEHGVDHVWTPKKRVVKDRLRYLICGAEATRKGGWDTINLFRRAFPTNQDVELTVKMVNSNWNGVKRLGRVHYLNKRMAFDELQDLFYDHHIYVYPSHGEGFGLTPLQAMATAMPTITLPAWAPYADFIDPNLAVGSDLKPSSWHEIHPGKMWRPRFDDVVDALRYSYNNYEKVQDFAMSQTDELHKRYDWDTLTAEAFGSLEKRLKL